MQGGTGCTGKRGPLVGRAPQGAPPPGRGAMIRSLSVELGSTGNIHCCCWQPTLATASLPAMPSSYAAVSTDMTVRTVQGSGKGVSRLLLWSL